jgi:hypothetical protein
MAIILSLVIFPVVYIATIYPVMILAHYLDTQVLGNIEALYKFDTSKDVWSYTGSYISIQSLVLLCSIYFRRYVTIKTLISTILIFYGIISLYPVVQNSILKTSEVKFSDIHIRQLAYNANGRLVGDTIIKQDVHAFNMHGTGLFSDIKLSQLDLTGAHTKNMELGIPYNTNYLLELSPSEKLFFKLLFIISIPFL